MSDVRTNTSGAMSAHKLAEQARNRENQRRLRERRKGYTAELERKLRVLEHDGVLATQVMQKAARIVVEENKLLRQLLGRHGVSDVEIREFVKSSSIAGPDSRQDVVQRGRPMSTTSLSELEDGLGRQLESETSVSLVPIQAQVDGRGPPAIFISDPHDSEPSLKASPIDAKYTQPENIWTQLPPAASIVTKTIAQSPAAPGTIPRATGCGTAEPRLKTHADQMDCEDAARIITSLRGRHDPQDVWSELGCSHVNRTVVTNAHLMSLVE